jgi:hypothetical protein
MTTDEDRARPSRARWKHASGRGSYRWLAPIAVFVGGSALGCGDGSSISLSEVDVEGTDMPAGSWDAEESAWKALDEAPTELALDFEIDSGELRCASVLVDLCSPSASSTIEAGDYEVVDFVDCDAPADRPAQASAVLFRGCGDTLENWRATEGTAKVTVDDDEARLTLRATMAAGEFEAPPHPQGTFVLSGDLVVEGLDRGL